MEVTISKRGVWNFLQKKGLVILVVLCKIIIAILHNVHQSRLQFHLHTWDYKKES